MNKETIEEAAKPEYLTRKGKLAMKRYEEFATFRKNFIILRASKGITGEQMAEDLNLRSTKRVFDFECGRCHPRFDEIRGIAKLFNVTIDELMYKTAKIIFE